MERYSQQARTGEETPITLARSLYTVLLESFVHASPYRLQFTDNWYLWVIAQLSDDEFKRTVLLDTQNAELLWKRGAGYCHQVAWIFAKYARDLDLKSGLVKLNNHYVAEVDIGDGNWHTVDPDLGLWWPGRFSTGAIAIPPDLVRQALEKNGFQPEHARRLSLLYDLPPEKRIRMNFYSSANHYLQELNTFWLMWAIPIVLLGLWSALELTGLLMRKRD